MKKMDGTEEKGGNNDKGRQGKAINSKMRTEKWETKEGQKNKIQFFPGCFV